MTRSRSLLLAFAMATLTISAAADTEAREARTTPAARTRFHFDDIPVRSALQLLAEEGGIDLVVSDTVTGTVSLHLDDVTWEQALAVVVRLKGLDLRVVGGSRVVSSG